MSWPDGVTVMACPFCGVTPTVQVDHHGAWFAHPDGVQCIAAAGVDLYDEGDVERWNHRINVEHRPPIRAARQLETSE